jgi:N-acylneuraminate cytidylyltransferase/pseudaminic acid cytidylyltransferase
MPKAIAIIPARGGSKRIPKKNIKLFHGKPLIAYSIGTALSANVFEKVIVSTDDPDIARIAQDYGADVPFVRPANLSDDFSTTQAVIDHALQWLAQHDQLYDFACTIYATAPLLQPEYLVKGLDALLRSDATYAFSAASMPFPIQRTFKITPNGRCEMFMPEHFATRSQDLEEAYHDAGQFYWQNLHRPTTENMFGSASIPTLLPRHLVQDIDTLEDWDRAEALYSVLHHDKLD